MTRVQPPLLYAQNAKHVIEKLSRSSLILMIVGHRLVGHKSLIHSISKYDTF